jgi:hypothetical protein
MLNFVLDFIDLGKGFLPLTSLYNTNVDRVNSEIARITRPSDSLSIKVIEKRKGNETAAELMRPVNNSQEQDREVAIKPKDATSPFLAPNLNNL